MSVLVWVVLAAGFAVAFVNGANDVSKSIATLVGSGVMDLRRATRWGTLCTALGGLAGILLGGAMVSAFQDGLLASDTEPVTAAALATLMGATLCVLLATRVGMPVSTTHALVGALAGAGVVAYGLDAVQWRAIGGKLALPLLLSPLVSLALTWMLLASRRRAGSSLAAADCVCIDTAPPNRALVPAQVAGSTTAHTNGSLVSPGPALVVGDSRDCPPAGPGLLRVTADGLHWLSSGATGFARGLNDAPKMAALALATLALGGHHAPGVTVVYVVITLGMSAGSLVAGRRVTRLLAHRVTPMDHQEGFIANAVTALLVTGGALGGLPMSTTHVSSVAIMGVGASRGRGSLDSRTLRHIVLAWLITLPVAAALAAVSFAIFVRWS